jgi:hypothetical protein
MDRDVISLRRMTLGSGYRYLMESVAVGDGALGQSSNLTRYYAESGTPPGVFLGAGLASLDDGRGVEAGSPMSEEHLFNLLGMCADPVTGKPLGRQPNRSHLPLSKRIAQRVEAMPAMATASERAAQTARIESEERARTTTFRTPVAGFDLTASSTSRCNGPTMMVGSPRSNDQWRQQHARPATSRGRARGDPCRDRTR